MTPALRRAITLRQWTRVALAANDLPAALRRNRLADQAYLLLDPAEACAYLAWARSSGA